MSFPPSSLFTALFLFTALPAWSQADTITLHVTHAACDTTITLARLQQLTSRSATITSHDGEQATYTGALLWDVIGAGCSSVTTANKRDRVGMAVRVEATDGYHAVVALMEADTSFRDRPVLLCWQKNGQPLDAHNGPLQLIVPDDNRHARDVRMVSRLTIVVP